MFKKMTKKKTKISPKKKLHTSNCEKMMTEDKIVVTKSNKDKLSAPAFNVNAPKDDKKLVKTQGKRIKKKKKIYSKIHNINYLKNVNAVVPSEKRHYSQIEECFVLLSDYNEHNKNHKSDKASNNNNAKNSSEKDKDYSSMLKTKEQNIKKKKKEDSKDQNIKNLINDNDMAHTKKKLHSQMNECFVLLSDCYEHKKNHKSYKGSTSNNTKNSLENDKDYSSMLKTKEQNIKKKKKEDSKDQNINNLINDNDMAHTKKKLHSQMNECFVLLSDCYEHKKNHKSYKGSTSNNTKNSLENDKDYSSMLKTKEQNIKKKKKEDSKVKNINNLTNDNAKNKKMAHTKKKHYSQIDECFVLLTDCNEHKKNHKSYKGFTSNNTKNSLENDKDYSSMLKTKEQNIKKKKKEDSKDQNINNLINDNDMAHTKKKLHSQMNECFVLLSDCYEHKKNHKSHKGFTSNNIKNSSDNDKDYSSMLKTNEQNIKKKKKDDSEVQSINNLINVNAVAHTKKRQYSHMNECIVLLSDFNEHKTNHKSDKASTSNNTKNISENDKDYSSIFKTRGKKIKINDKFKVQKINNLENDNAAILTEKRHSQLKECFVLLSDFDKNKTIIHKPNKASSRKKTMVGLENSKEYLSILGKQEQNITNIYKKDSKVKKIKKL